MEIVDAQSLSEKEFDGMALDRPFLDLFGWMPMNFQALIWGGEGSGKSTLAMGLARALVPFAREYGDGPVLYVSSEEGPSMTTSMRAGRLGARSKELKISNFRSIQALRDAILRLRAPFVIIDSVTVVDPSTTEAKEFMHWLREEGLGVALIAQALKEGGYRGSRRLGHDVDAVVKCYQDDEGICRARTVKTRYLGFGPGAENPIREIEIPMSAGGIEEVRDNPDCSITPQSAQCKAIFASLDESGEKQSGKDKSKSTSSDSSSKNKSTSSSSSSSGGDSSGGSNAGDSNSGGNMDAFWEGLDKFNDLISKHS